MARLPTLIAFLARGLVAATLCNCEGRICEHSKGHAYRATSGPFAGRMVESGHDPARLPAMYRCLSCREWWPWCIGAADDAPEICDSCWCDGRPKMAAATARKDAAPAAGKG